MLVLLRYGVVQEEILRIVSALGRGRVPSRGQAQNRTCDGHGWQWHWQALVRAGDETTNLEEVVRCA